MILVMEGQTELERVQWELRSLAMARRLSLLTATETTRFSTLSRRERDLVLRRGQATPEAADPSWRRAPRGAW